MSEITRVLSAVEQRDPQAVEQLLPLVYDELRKLAASRLAHEKPGQTLQATALVHEAYMRLVGPVKPVDAQSVGIGDSLAGSGPANGTHWNGCGHFFAAAAEAMRRILVERARRKQQVKHGGDFRRVDLDSQIEIGHEADHNLVALDEALEQLEHEDPACAAVVKLRYFAGLTIEEAARTLAISVRTANRHWAYARAWLYEQLQ